jgi:polyhydroxyalkanoate synthesis repressor PhaR
VPHCGTTLEMLVTGVRTMIRVVKRYGSRKLYDTEESRYVSLEDLGDFVRAGQEIKVVDNSNDEDVTAQMLMQVILEEGKRGTSLFTSNTLHDLIRRGERVVTSGVEQLQEGVDRLLDVSLDHIGPLRRVREEAEELRDRLARLEETIAELEIRQPAPAIEQAPLSGAKAHVAPARKSKPTRM